MRPNTAPRNTTSSPYRRESKDPSFLRSRRAFDRRTIEIKDARVRVELILSPFEKAALKLALRQRDSKSRNQTALICGAEAEKLAFAICA
jgi:hypothetical protein